MRRTWPRRIHACIVAGAVAMIVSMTTRPDPEPGPDDVPRGSAPTPATLAAAVDATRALASARVELQTTVTGPSGPVVLVHRAAFADGGVRARAESDMSQVASVLEEAGQQLDGDWTRPAGIVVDGDTVFSQLGPMADALGRAPDDWVSARLSEVTASGSAADNDTLALVLDPLGPLDLLRRPVVDIEATGDDEVRGEPAEHLRASLDLTAGASSGLPAGSFESRLVASGVESLPVDVWLDAAGLVRRLAVTVEAAGSLTTVFEVYDVGADVDVDAPDPSEVITP